MPPSILRGTQVCVCVRDASVCVFTWLCVCLFLWPCVCVCFAGVCVCVSQVHACACVTLSVCVMCYVCVPLRYPHWPVVLWGVLRRPWFMVAINNEATHSCVYCVNAGHPTPPPQWSRHWCSVWKIRRNLSFSFFLTCVLSLWIVWECYSCWYSLFKLGVAA